MILSKKISAVIEISRPINFLITFFSIFVAGIICSKGEFQSLYIILASISGALTGSAGNIINDYFDLEIDKINRPARVLPREELTPNQALLVYLLFSSLAVLLAILINTAALLIVLAATSIIFFYSFSLKKIPLFSNVVVALMTGLAFIYGGVAVGNWKLSIIPAVFAFFINFIREIVKDMEDTAGDKSQGIITVPIKFGFGISVNIIFAATILLIISTFIPFVFQVYKIEYFIVVMVLVNVLFVYFLKELKRDQSKNSLCKLSNILKLNMVFGLAAIYLGI